MKLKRIKLLKRKERVDLPPRQDYIPQTVKPIEGFNDSFYALKKLRAELYNIKE